MTNETIVIPDVTGRIVEAGRFDGTNHIVIDVGRGQLVRLSGLSDDLTRRFAKALFKPLIVEFGVHDE